MKISFALLCHDETESLKQIFESILVEREYEYEVVVIFDKGENSNKTEDIINDYSKKNDCIKIYERSLNNDFASQKNFMTEKCTGDYIFNIDADEFFSEYLLENIHLIIEQNNVEVLWLPRINTVDGITEQWAMNFGFKIFPDISKAIAPINEKIMNIDSDEYKLLKKIELIVEEILIKKEASMELFKVKYYLPIISYPDFQGRIYKNNYPQIHWERPVHERLVGYKTYSIFPHDNLEIVEHIAIKHPKTIDRQIKQNQKYAKIMGM